MRYSKHSIYTRTPIIGLSLFLSACQSDYLNNPSSENWKNDNKIQFDAFLEESTPVYTRAEKKGTPGLDSSYVKHDPWSMDFYIELNTKAEDGEDDIVKYATYVVKSGYEGRLDPKDIENTLNWETLTQEHTFYSWTVPMNETQNNFVLKESAEEPAEPSEKPSEEPYTPSAEPLKVNFFNSSEAKGYSEHQNNAILEGFIGAKSAPYSYDKHGKYVELTFHHLVSKIIVESIIMIKTDGSVQEDLQADMTFIGMPTQATFYPHPTLNDTKSGAPANSGPYVGGPYEKSPQTGVTYYIANQANSEDVFYICPEIDFSKIDYRIKLNSEEYLNYDTYYGTFDDVVFERTQGYGYDQGEGKDSKILHAGEIMKINIVLIPGIGPGLRIIISEWSTDKPTDAQYHATPGIYSDAEIQQFLDLLFSFSAEDYENPPAELEWLFEMYGYEENGKKYIPLFENIRVKKGANDSNIFPVPDGYIIDGMGHTITMASNGGIAATNGIRYFNIGPVRNVYVTDGTNMIYIDPDGYVWIQDENGELVNSNNQLPELESPYKGYDINIEGYIRLTSYFNDHITG